MSAPGVGAAWRRLVIHDRRTLPALSGAPGRVPMHMPVLSEVTASGLSVTLPCW